MDTFYIDKSKMEAILASIGSIEAILQQARETINRGGHVVIQQDYVNAKPGIERVIKSLEDLGKWSKEVLK